MILVLNRIRQRLMKNITRYFAALIIASSFLTPVANGSLWYNGAFQDDKQEKKKPLPPVHYVRSRDFDTKHIALDLRFKWETEQTIGVEEFTFVSLDPALRRLVLDAGLMSFESIRLKDGGALKFKYDEKKAKLTIEFPEAIGLGEERTVVIRYITKGKNVPNSLGFGGGGGLKFVKPSKKKPNNPWQIWSQGESEYNKYWFPSYDYPNDFRTTELTATVRKPFIVISNGRLAAKTENPDGTRTFRWKMDTPYANYLTSIVIGEYAEVRGAYKGIPVITYVYKKWEKEGEITARRLPEMVRFYSENLNLKYPYPKYAQTIAREFGGGMENISATTQTDNMIIDERTELDRDFDGLQAHELAHQWFGDYVTCRDWSEIWLNESFATYMEALWQLRSKGKDEFLYAKVKGNQDGYFGAWRQGRRRPIVTKYYANPDAVFDSYAYPRGGAVLHMLHKQLGDRNFWASLNHYLTSNANQPVSTEDLRIAIEETTGRSMDAFFDQWLYKMGHPVFDVKKSYDAAKRVLTLTVRQVQEPDLTSGYPQVGFFETPVDIEIVTNKGPRIETVFIKPRAENVFRIKGVESAPLMVDFDNEGTLIKELRFERPVKELVFQLRNDLDVLGRFYALDQLSRIARDKKTAADQRSLILREIRRTATADGFWRLRRDAVNRLRSIFSPSPSGSKPLTLDEQTTATLIKAAADSKSLVRSAAISLLGATRSPRFATLYRKAVLSDRSYAVIDSASMALARSGDEDAYPILRKLAQTGSWRDRVQIAGLNALAELGDKNALDLGFRIGSDYKRSAGLRTAALGVVAALGKGDPRAFPLVFENYKDALEQNSFGQIFSGLRSLIRIADPRGQEAFDLARSKFKENKSLIRFLDQLESQFKKAASNGN